MPLWTPRSGAFDGGQLRGAIVMRGWTIAEFAALSKISLACLYRTLGGCRVTDRTAIRIFEGLRQGDPLPLPEVPNAR
jgi:predicted transcriptional regulator